MSDESFVYYGRIDYPQLILRQLDRIASIRTKLSYPVNRIELEEYRNAVMTLYFLSPPAVRDEVGLPASTDLGSLDMYLVKLRDALEKRGLIGGNILERGRPDVNVHKKSA